MEWHCYTATLAVMTNVRGTGWDWPRNKFSLPSGARGRRKHTRLPKIKDRDHFREESTSTKSRPRKTRRETCAQEKHRHRWVVTRAKNTRRELRGVAISPSRTPTIENQARPRTIKRPSRRSNMEIGRVRTPTVISSNASHITPPTNKSTKQFVTEVPAHRMHETRMSSKQRSVANNSLITHHKYLGTYQKVTRTKGAQNLALMKTIRTGCNKTKGVVRKGDTVTIIIIVVRKRKLEQEKKGCWRQRINYNMTRERMC